MSGEPKVKRAKGTPSPGALDDLASWAQWQNAGIARSQKAADVWRNGLAGFVTLLLSVLVIKGSDLADVAEPSKTIAIVCCLAGTLLAIAGLWRTLLTEAPSEKEQTYTKVLEKYGSIAGYEQAIALSGQRRLRQARRLVLGALLLLAVGIGAWWFAPVPTAEPSRVQVTWSVGAEVREVCGALIPSPERQIVVLPAGGEDVVAVAAGDVVRITLTEACE